MIFKMCAERYAGALFAVAFENDELDDVTADIRTIDEIFEKVPEVRKYCLSANIADNNAKIVIEEAFIKYLKTAKCANTLRLMAENKRLASLPSLSDAFCAILAEKENRLTVSAQFATEPDPEVLEKLKQKMSDKSGKIVELDLEVKPELIGGFILQWSDRMLDKSVKGRLKQLKTSVKC